MSFHWNTYHPNLKVYCVELEMEPGESLARLSSMPTMVVFANLVFLPGGVVVVVSNPFGLQGENSV
jgi:hypothetical protein